MVRVMDELLRTTSSYFDIHFLVTEDRRLASCTELAVHVFPIYEEREHRVSIETYPSLRDLDSK